jgi:hypothetical protein
VSEWNRWNAKDEKVRTHPSPVLFNPRSPKEIVSTVSRGSTVARCCCLHARLASPTFGSALPALAWPRPFFFSSSFRFCGRPSPCDDEFPGIFS